MADLYKLKREFLEYCELEKGQSMLTINSYSRYLDRFLVFLATTKIQNHTEIQNDQKTPDLSALDKSRSRDDNEDFNKLSFSGRQRSDPGIQAEMAQQNNSLDPGSPATVRDDNSNELLPADVTQEAVREYRLHINRLRDKKGDELKKTTQNYHILALRSFLRYLAWRGIPSLPPEKVAVAKAEDRKINFLEADEVKNILDLPRTGKDSDVRDRAILELLFSTGLRVSELAALNVDEINFTRGEIAVLGKGKKVRLVFLSEEAIKLLSEYLIERGLDPNSETKPKDEPLFLSNRDTRLTVRSIERLVKRYAQRAGITKKVSPHTLRHSFATDLLVSGADIRSVQSLLGHSSISTTQIYTHVTDQHLRDVHQRFHGKSLEDKEDKSK